MTYTHLRTHKAYRGSNQPHIFSSICLYTLFQKLQSIISVIVLCSSCLLYVTGFKCNPTGSHLSEGMEPDPIFSRSTASSLQVSPSALAKGVAPLSVDPLPLQQDQSLSIVGALTKDGAGMTHLPTKDGAGMTHPTHVGLGQPSVLEKPVSAALPSMHGSSIGSILDKASTDIKRHGALSKALEDLEKWIRNQKELKIRIKSIESIEIVALIRKVKNEIILGRSNKTPLKLCLALQVIQKLTSVLELEIERQEEILYFPSDSLKPLRQSLIERLDALQESVCKNLLEVTSVNQLLNQVIQSLQSLQSTCYGFYETYYTLCESYPMKNISSSIKQSLMGDAMQLEQAKEILNKLNNSVCEQSDTIEGLDEKLLQQASDVLIDVKNIQNVQKNIETLLVPPLKEVASAIRPLKIECKLQPQVQILEGKVRNSTRLQNIITDLQSFQQYISDMPSMNYKELNKRNKAEIDKTLEYALGIEKCVEDIRSITAHIIDQAEALKALLASMDPLGDEAAWY